MKLGVFINLTEDIEKEFEKVRDMGISTCQLNGWNKNLFTDHMSNEVKRIRDKYEVEVTSFWCGWNGPMVWDFYSGPCTLGLVPEAYRNERLEMLKRGSDFAKHIEVENLITHVGFIPEDPNNSVYRNLIPALRYLTQYCGSNGQNFMFETGQETPVTLLRAIEDIGLENLGVNLDPANLVIYGKANPVDALDIIGKYVRGVHGKDALYPTTGRCLGKEVPLGEGKVNYSRLIPRLKEIGYDGPITIEREISGKQQIKDILHAKKLLEELIK